MAYRNSDEKYPYANAVKWYMQQYYPEEYALHNFYNDWSRCTINKNTLKHCVLETIKASNAKTERLIREKLGKQMASKEIILANTSASILKPGYGKNSIGELLIF